MAERKHSEKCSKTGLSRKEAIEWKTGLNRKEAVEWKTGLSRKGAVGLKKAGRKGQERSALNTQIERYKAARTNAGEDAGEEAERLSRTLEAVKQAFYEGEQERCLSWQEFLFQQAVYIRKRWWLGQMLILMILWWLLQTAGSGRYVQRSMGVLASVFAVMLIPELWKNRTNHAMEIEGASYFSLRQIYAARVLLFAVADALLLGVFFIAATTAARMTIWEAVIQFFLPFNVTCCICFQVLCSRSFSSEYMAVGMCMLWTAVWESVILREEFYSRVQIPVWTAAVVFSVCYLIYAVQRTLRGCVNSCEAYDYRDWI